MAGSLAVNRLLEDGEVFDLGCGPKLRVFHTPGHSKGSISILLLGYMALFTGDAVPVPGEMPIYEDRGFGCINQEAEGGAGNPASAFFMRQTQEGGNGLQRMEEGLQYLPRIHAAVITVPKMQIHPIHWNCLGSC